MSECFITLSSERLGGNNPQKKFYRLHTTDDQSDYHKSFTITFPPVRLTSLRVQPTEAIQMYPYEHPVRPAITKSHSVSYPNLLVT